jgi:hypothetical protein
MGLPALPVANPNGPELSSIGTFPPGPFWQEENVVFYQDQKIKD